MACMCVLRQGKMRVSLVRLNRIKKIQTSQLFASGIFYSVFPVGIYAGYLKSQRATIQTKEGHCEWMLFTLISLLRFLGGMVTRQPAAK